MKYNRIHHDIFLGAIMAALIVSSCKPPAKQVGAHDELFALKALIEKQIKNDARRISEQLVAFSKVAAADRDFPMKLFVEGNRSAPEVTDFTHRFMEPMGLSLLAIADSSQTILSCAQFPANTGTTIAGNAAMLGEEAQFVYDNVKGQKVLTLQAKVRFRILDTLFYCIGGRIVDDAFISERSPGNGYTLILKMGPKVLGTNNAQSIADITDSTIAMNGIVYPAVFISLPFAGQGETPKFILLSEKTVIPKS
jgi:hypothetical protein